MEQITQNLFKHLVDLAALELTDKEAEYLRCEMNHQLKAIHELEAIPLSDDLIITSHGIHYSDEDSVFLRDDENQNNQNEPCVNDILSQVPQFEEGYVVVPDIEYTALS